MDFGDLSDKQLIERYFKEDEAAFEVLVKRYLPLVYGFSRRFTGDPEKAADIAQETFVKAWRSLKKFDTAKSFKTWLFAIAKNTALDWLRRRTDIPFSVYEREDAETSFIESIADNAEPLEVLLARKYAAESARRAAGSLPKYYAEVLLLRDDEALTFREISELLRTPLNTVKSRYRRALLLLREQLQEGASRD